MHILHLSADYPDPLQPAKTKAIKNLLGLVQDHRHSVYALNRVPPDLGTTSLAFDDEVGEDQRAVAYGAPGKGWRHLAYLQRLADWVLADIAARGLKPDIIHAHKLTIEGVVARIVADRLSVPFLVSIQGNTDSYIARMRPDLRPVFAKIWHGSAVAFPFAPWAQDAMEARFGVRENPVALLPCPGPGDRKIPPKPVGPLVRSAFHLRDAANKNASALIQAVNRARRAVPGMTLEIMGGGDPAAYAKLAAQAAKCGEGTVQFLGSIAHGKVQDRFNAAGAFAMVSHRESFGMVYSEALLAGCPCLIGKGRGISGYFEEESVVVAVDPKDGAAIEAGLERLCRDEAAFKDRLGSLMQSGGLDFLRQEGIAATYKSALERSVA